VILKANALGTGTHKRKETYANEVLTIARAETNLYDDFSIQDKLMYLQEMEK